MPTDPLQDPLYNLVNKINAPGKKPNKFLGQALTNAFKQRTVSERAGSNLRTDVMRLGDERAAMQPAKARHIGGAGNAANRLRSRLGRDATMAVAQADTTPQVSFRGALDQATKRMRARQGIVNRGEKAIANQTLRDRVQIARNNATRRGAIHNTLQTTANIREGVNVGVANANQMVAMSRANMFGTIAGAGVSFIQGKFGNKGERIDPNNPGTATADYQNMNPQTDYSDPFAYQPPVNV